MQILSLQPQNCIKYFSITKTFFSHGRSKQFSKQNSNYAPSKFENLKMAFLYYYQRKKTIFVIYLLFSSPVLTWLGIHIGVQGDVSIFYNRKLYVVTRSVTTELFRSDLDLCPWNHSIYLQWALWYIWFLPGWFGHKLSSCC